MTTLRDELDEATRTHGLCEIIVRVNREEHGVPVSWQAITKFQERVTGPWGVAIRANPYAAMQAAIAEGVAIGERNKPSEESGDEGIFG